MNNKVMKIIETLCASIFLVACGQSEQQTGNAVISVRSGAIYQGTANVQLQVFAGADKPYGSPGALFDGLIDELSPGIWSKTIDNLPAGVYSFCAKATAGALTFGPSCANATITKNALASVTILLQQVGNDGHITIDSPLITGISLSDASPFYGENVTISATVTDQAPTNLTYSWTGSCDGAPGTPATVTFSAPHALNTILSTDCRGTVSVTFAAADGGINSSVTFPLKYYPQGAAVTVSLNRFPALGGFTVQQAQLAPGQGTDLGITAQDDEPLTYTWSKTCGTLATPSAQNGTNHFTAPNTAGDCTVTVAVTDGLGGSSTASVILHVRPPFLVAQPFTSVCNGPPDWTCGSTNTPGVSAYIDTSGLHLSKIADDPQHYYGAGANLIGVAGMPFVSASFDTTDVVANGSPRFVMSFTDGANCLVDNAIRTGDTYTFTPSSLYTACAGHGTITSAYVVIDGGGAAQTVTLTNIKVNDSIVLQ